MNKNFASYIIAILTFILVTNSCNKDENTVNQEPDVNYFGALPDPTANFTVFTMPSGGGYSIPNSCDLSNLMPPIRNQGTQGSCVAFALATLKSYHEQQQYGYTFADNSKIMSPAFIYNQVKEAGDCLIGSRTMKALDFLKQNGVCSEAEFPYNESDCSLKPSSSIIKNAIKNKIKEWEGFNFGNSDVTTQMKYAITQKQPVIIDFKVDAEFVKFGEYSWGGWIWKKNNSGNLQNGGYHCALLVGYDDKYNSFLLLNSWGKTWKNMGYCWVDYDWLLKRINYAFITWDDFGGGSADVSPVAEFSIDGNTTIPVGSSIQFRDKSLNKPTSWLWSFPYGNPSSSTEQDPKVVYNSRSGKLNVCLTVSNNNGSNSITKSMYINVEGPGGAGGRGDFTDTRDGQVYTTHLRNGQEYFGPLNYASLNSITYNGNRYYTYADALNSVPNGWRIQSDSEWMDYEMWLGMCSTDATLEGWRDAGTTCDFLGYNGYATNNSSGKINGYNIEGAFWTSTAKSNDQAYGRLISTIYPTQISRKTFSKTSDYLTVRWCVRDR